jgi:hypothetical protein
MITSEQKINAQTDTTERPFVGARLWQFTVVDVSGSEVCMEFMLYGEGNH